MRRVTLLYYSLEGANVTVLEICLGEVCGWKNCVTGVKAVKQRIASKSFGSLVFHRRLWFSPVC